MAHLATIVINLINFYLIVIGPSLGQHASVSTQSRSRLNYHQKCFKNVSTNQIYEHTTVSPRFWALTHRYCLDLPLPYGTIALPDNPLNLSITSFADVDSYLQRWQELRYLPKCWPYLQKALCSILMPEYYDSHSITNDGMARVSRPSVEICKDMVNSCKFIENNYGTQAIFNCADTNLYARNCSNELRDLKTNTSSEVCQYPLIWSNDAKNFFRDINGCTLHCKYPILNQDNQANVGLLIGLLSVVGFLMTSCSSILFSIGDRTSSRMAIVISWSCKLHLISYIGWSLRLMQEKDIACGLNGAPLYGLPLKNSACVISFLLTYPTSLSNLVLYAYLGRLCHEKLNGKAKKAEDSKEDSNMVYLSFGIPVTLLILVAFLGQIDGHGLYGICTTGLQSPAMKIVFIFFPKIAILYGNFYFSITIFKLISRKNMKPNLKRNLIRIFLLFTLSLMQICLDVGIYIYQHHYNDSWIDSIYKHLACTMNPRTSGNHNNGFIETENVSRSECAAMLEPVAVLYIMDIFSTLSQGIVIASWSLCEHNFRCLRKKLIRILDSEKNRSGTNDRSARARSDSETYHDMIDGPSPTIEFVGDNPVEVSNSLAPGSVLPSQASLSSISLKRVGLDFSKKRNKSRSNFFRYGSKKARDIVEDQRNKNIFQAEHQNIPIDPLPPPLDFTTGSMIPALWMQIRHSIFSNTYQQDPHVQDSTSEYEFTHGICQKQEPANGLELPSTSEQVK